MKIPLSLEEQIIVISDVLSTVEGLGLNKITPIVLGDAGNLIVHLAPYPIVARVAKLLDGDDSNFQQEIWPNELKVAKHLMEQGVPVVPFSNLVLPGPYQVADTWMSLWEYVESATLPPLGEEQLISLVTHLTKAMANFTAPLRPLRAWRNVNRAADFLHVIKDDRISKLLFAYESVNERIQNETLYPAHGDAHRRNLIPSSTGWRWTDFEDVSLMPKFWDLASFIANTIIFNGLKHPTVQYVLQSVELPERTPFLFALKARVIFGPMTNLSLAFRGHGDLDFAQIQLDRANDFLTCLESDSLWDS